jgi:hypothetical protein
MKKPTLIISTLAVVLGLGILEATRAGQAPARSDASVQKQKAALQSAQAWLALVDTGRYDESWDQAAQTLKDLVDKSQFATSVESARLPVGKLVSRKQKSATYTRTLPGVPEGDYVVILYNSSFENLPSAVETVTPMLDKDGKWRVSGYYLRPQ